MSPGSGLNLRGVACEKGLTGHSAHLAHRLFPGSAIQCDGKGQAGVLAQREAGWERIKSGFGWLRSSEREDRPVPANGVELWWANLNDP